MRLVFLLPYHWPPQNQLPWRSILPGVPFSLSPCNPRWAQALPKFPKAQLKQDENITVTTGTESPLSQGDILVTLRAQGGARGWRCQHEPGPQLGGSRDREGPGKQQGERSLPERGCSLCGSRPEDVPWGQSTHGQLTSGNAWLRSQNLCFHNMNPPHLHVAPKLQKYPGC